MIAGSGRIARRVIRCRNDHPAPEARYRIAAADLVNVVRIEDAGEDLVAIYHSHPRSQPYPSPTDRAEARYPDALYVLVSLWAEQPDLHAYHIADRESVLEVPISET
jgi:proteasome lid subunit RPN8/RPN11